jgi:hypothetical protein
MNGEVVLNMATWTRLIKCEALLEYMIEKFNDGDNDPKRILKLAQETFNEIQEESNEIEKL